METVHESEKIAMIDNKIYGFVTIGTKGQVVIPADAREALNLQSGDHLFVVGSKKKGVLALLPESSALDFVNKISKKVEDFNALRTSIETARESGPEIFED